MNEVSPFSDLSKLTENAPEKIKEFLTKLADPCADEPEDCGDVKSPCCQADISTVFGSLPLEVECKVCGKRHLLRNLVSKQ